MKVLKWLSIADRLAKSDLDIRLAPLGLNSSQHMYLLKICAQPGILQDSLLDSFYLHPSNIVRTVAALEKKGFLTREPYERDRRTWRLYPTQRALSIADQIWAACEETEAILLDGLSEDARQEFGRTLLRAGKQVAEQLNLERVEDEFDV